MPVTGLRGRQILDGDVVRADLNTTTAGSAVITRIIAGTNISITSTGVDAGTGDVTINATGGGSSLNGTGFVRMNGTTASYITGTSSQFVKADGSLDSSVYLTSLTDTLATVTARGASTSTVLTFTGGTDSNSSAVKFAGYNQRGGVGFHGAFEITNTFASATNPNKFFRLDSTGAFQIVNSAYTLNIFNLTDAGALTVPGSFTAASIVRSGGTSAQFLKADGSVDSSTYITGNQSITLSGDATGSGTTAITVTLANSGVTAGTYRSVTVDAKGRVTGGTNPTTLSGYGITDALSNSTTSTQSGYFGDIFLFDDSTPSHYLAITNSANLTAARTLSINVNDADRTISLSGNLTVSAAATVSGTNTGDQTITLTGDVTGSGTGSFATTLANSGVTAGTYNNVTVNAKGLVTGGSNVSYLTSYTETDTLATVTGRGASTTTAVTFTGGITIGGQGTGTGIIGNAGFTSNYTGISLNGTLSSSAYNFLSSPTEQTLYINRPTGVAIRFREANGADQMVIASGGATTFSSSVTASSFVRSGGTSSQFLKADGSVDSSTYALSSHTHSYFIGTTAVQTSSANQGITGISSIGFVAEGSDSASISTTISGTSTFFDFNLTDDNNNDEWRWRFTPSGATVYNAMRLVPVSNTASNLIVSGTITGSQIIRSGGTASQFLKADGSIDSNTYLTSYTETDTLATVTGRGATTSTAVTFNGNISVGSAASLSFGSQTRQMISLWSTLYGIGIQSSTLYFRTDGRFSWHRGGSHNDTENNAGGGTVAMTLDASSNLAVTGTLTASSIIRSGGTASQFLKADGSVDSNTYITSASVGNGTLTLAVSGTGLSGSASFTANQSGNTTFTVTSNATSANTASTIVARDASGNFSAGAITSTALYGTSYTTLTSGGGTGTAVYDTITTSGNRLYRVVISGNPNSAGSGSYLDWIYGKLIVGAGWNGSAVVNYIEFVQESPMPRTLFTSGGGDLTVDAVFFQSNAESDTVAVGSTYTVRFKISGYISSGTGASTTINLLQIG